MIGNLKDDSLNDFSKFSTKKRICSANLNHSIDIAMFVDKDELNVYKPLNM